MDSYRRRTESQSARSDVGRDPELLSASSRTHHDEGAKQIRSGSTTVSYAGIARGSLSRSNKNS